MKSKQIPNAVTLLRIVLVIPIIGFLCTEYYKTALYLFILAGVSDGIDGFLARRYNWFTRFGSIADPLADKLLMISTIIALAYLGKIPYWLLAVILTRDIIIVIGGLAYHYIIGRFELVPSKISKLNTFCQLILILFILFQASYNLVGDNAIENLIVLVLFTNIVSLVHYIFIWGTRAYRNAHHD